MTGRVHGIAAALGVFVATGTLDAPAQDPGAAEGWVKFTKPAGRGVNGARCLNDHQGTLGGVFGRSELPLLAFTINPPESVARMMGTSKVKFTGPGTYKDVGVMAYLGKTALEETYGGLGTITVNADWRSGTFSTNDGKTSGTWDCGRSLR
jgi:hypothetical protein